MNKVLRLVLFLTLGFTASWSSLPKAAFAVPSCEALDDTFCSTSVRIPCIFADSTPGSCSCFLRAHNWLCG